MTKVYGKIHKLASMIAQTPTNNDSAFALALKAAMPTEKLTRDKRGRFTPLVLATCNVDSIGKRDAWEMLADVAVAKLRAANAIR